MCRVNFQIIEKYNKKLWSFGKQTQYLLCLSNLKTYILNKCKLILDGSAWNNCSSWGIIRNIKLSFDYLITILAKFQYFDEL